MTRLSRLRLCAALFTLTSCSLSATSYAGEPLKVAVDACIDYVGQRASTDAISRGLAEAGWTFEAIKKSNSKHAPNESHAAHFGGFDIYYLPLGYPHETSKLSPPRYSCYIGATAEDDAQATNFIDQIKARTGIKDRVIANDQIFGFAAIRRNKFSQGTRVKVHVNFDRYK